MGIVSTLGVATWDSVHACIACDRSRDSNCDRICDSVCDSTVGSDPLRIVATSLQIHLSSLCADAHRQTLSMHILHMYSLRKGYSLSTVEIAHL